MTPLLSICIPTFDRAGLLRSCLASIAPQVADLDGRVELVVSDNASEDETRATVAEFADQVAVSYHRSSTNVGPIANVRAAVEAARGTYCWVLGDDDLIRPGGVAAVVEALEREPSVDYVFVNFSVHVVDRSSREFVEPADFTTWTATGIENLSDRDLERWEQLVGEEGNAMTPIYASVFRRQLWLDHGADLGVGDVYSSAASTYPHAVLFARTMVGRPARVLGRPWVVMCGEESWSNFVPLVILVRFHDLLDVYQESGVPPELLDRHRRRMLAAASGPLAAVLAGARPAGLEGFRVARFLQRHWHYREARAVVLRELVAEARRRLRRRKTLAALLRWVRRLAGSVSERPS